MRNFWPYLTNHQCMGKRYTQCTERQLDMCRKPKFGLIETEFSIWYAQFIQHSNSVIFVVNSSITQVVNNYNIRAEQFFKPNQTKLVPNRIRVLFKNRTKIKLLFCPSLPTTTVQFAVVLFVRRKTINLLQKNCLTVIIEYCVLWIHYPLFIMKYIGISQQMWHLHSKLFNCIY